VTPRPDPLLDPEDEAGFRAFVQQLFGMRRKQLRRVIRTVAALDAAGAEAVLAAAAVDPDARPETLAPARLAELFRAVRAGRAA
jgi:16S rRNA (adenine1518-N6/adenine1519-N6)-dimethyltransferase